MAEFSSELALPQIPGFEIEAIDLGAFDLGLEGLDENTFLEDVTDFFVDGEIDGVNIFSGEVADPFAGGGLGGFRRRLQFDIPSIDIPSIDTSFPTTDPSAFETIDPSDLLDLNDLADVADLGDLGDLGNLENLGDLGDIQDAIGDVANIGDSLGDFESSLGELGDFGFDIGDFDILSPSANPFSEFGLMYPGYKPSQSQKLFAQAAEEAAILAELAALAALEEALLVTDEVALPTEDAPFDPFGDFIEDVGDFFTGGSGTEDDEGIEEETATT